MNRQFIAQATCYLLIASALCAFGARPGYCSADKATLAVTRNDTPLTEALDGVAKSAGVAIVEDSTVIDSIGLTTIKDAPVETILSTVAGETPGIAWTKLYISKDAKIPDGDTLFAQVKLLRSLPVSDLTVVDPVKKNAVALKQLTGADATPDQTPAGMQVVYLVTNENVRASRVAAAAAEQAKKNSLPVQNAHDTAVNSMQSFSNSFSQLSPQDQAQVLPQLMQQIGDAMQNLSPDARQALRQQMRQNRANGGGGWWGGRGGGGNGNGNGNGNGSGNGSGNGNNGNNGAAGA